MEDVLIIILVLVIIGLAVLLLGKFQKEVAVDDVSSSSVMIRNLRQQNLSLQYDIQNLKKHREGLEHEKDVLKQSDSFNRQQITLLENKLDAAYKEQKRLRQECFDKKAIIQGLNFECNNLKDSLKEMEEELENVRWKYADLDEMNDASEAEIRRLNETIDSFNGIIQTKNPFDYVAHLRAHALEYLGQCNNMSEEELAELLKKQYKLEYLLSVYPELRKFKNDEAYIQYIEEEERRCCIRNWLPKGAYDRLSEIEREQLAVDRYIKQEGYQWSDWEKGRNYEIYVAYRLYNNGYDIVQEGLNRRLEDKGRDIMATHRETGRVLVVQCKNWQEHSLIRENVIFQLYGSYMQWLVENNKNLSDDVVPCLYYTCELSPVAKECAEMLKVECVHFPMGYFPPIKCNVNKGKKIYHLPFDRHYDLVKINEKGKGYKDKVAEAIKEGFRRAYNH